MLKIILGAFIAVSCISPSTQKERIVSNTESITDTTKNIYSFKVDGLDGSIIDFSAFRGKSILIVNTASECGFTPQYAELEELYEKYKDKLVIVGFPANDFGGQEPGSDAEIGNFCKKNYGVSFPMASKVSIKGTDSAPIYQWLTQKNLNHVLDAEVKWNFNKFLIDRNGNLLAHYPSATSPLSEEITGKL